MGHSGRAQPLLHQAAAASPHQFVQCGALATPRAFFDNKSAQFEDHHGLARALSLKTGQLFSVF
jgi:hypothetical protein